MTSSNQLQLRKMPRLKAGEVARPVMLRPIWRSYDNLPRKLVVHKASNHLIVQRVKYVEFIADRGRGKRTAMCMPDGSTASDIALWQPFVMGSDGKHLHCRSELCCSVKLQYWRLG